MLHFGNLNQDRRDTINGEPALPKLPANPTYGGHRGIDENGAFRTRANANKSTGVGG